LDFFVDGGDLDGIEGGKGKPEPPPGVLGGDFLGLWGPLLGGDTHETISAVTPTVISNRDKRNPDFIRSVFFNIHTLQRLNNVAS
jgi:hypothetical protein